MEATKERAARCNRATPARKSDSQPAHGSRTQSITRRRRRAKARIRQAAVLLTAAVIVAGIGVAVSTIGTDRQTAAYLPTPTAEQPAVVIPTPAASTQTPEPTETPARYPLSVSERDTVERVVMAEAGGESFAGQMLVAQCILNAAEKEGVQPSEAVEIYSYTSNRPDPTQSVKDAVAAVFDRGEVAIDAPVMYFYNPRPRGERLAREPDLRRRGRRPPLFRRKEPKRMRPATDMKPGETLHLRNGYTVELESVKPVTCGVMLTFKASTPDRKENHNER